MADTMIRPYNTPSGPAGRTLLVGVLVAKREPDCAVTEQEDAGSEHRRHRGGGLELAPGLDRRLFDDQRCLARIQLAALIDRPGLICVAGVRSSSVSSANFAAQSRPCFAVQSQAVIRGALDADGLRQMETWLSLSEVKGAPSQSAHRCSNSIPASSAMRSHSAGQM